MLRCRLVLVISFVLLVHWCGTVTGSAECNWNGETQGSGCKCYEGFKGDTCDVDCGCQSHGTCNDDDTCACEPGWKWDNNKCVYDCPCSNCIGPYECECPSPCVNGACKNGVCVCHAGFTGDTCNILDRDTMPNKDVQVGMNLGGISYYSAEVKWVDVFKQSMDWLTQRHSGGPWNTNELDNITFRSDYYPASLEGDIKLSTLVYRGFGPHEETGEYTILYDGEGEITFGLTEYHYKYKGKGRLVVEFPNIKDGGILLSLSRTNPSNPLHNIRVLPPGYEFTYERFPYHPDFLEGLTRFSEFRFMDFMHTNGHSPEPTTWSSRRTPDYQTQAGGAGGALEHMVELCNLMGTNPWFCMPHAADDDYIKKFAQFVKANLRQDLKIYIEYSNEVWNGIFRQTKYTQEQGAPLFPDDPGFKQGMKYYNLRASQVADIWKQEFGTNSDRIVSVWAWQTGYRDYTRQALEDLGDRKSSFDAMAITGYFDCGDVVGSDSPGITALSTSEIQTWCDDDLPNQREAFTHYIGVAKANGLKLLMYEGGPGIMENGAIVNGQNQEDVTNAAIAFHQADAIQKPVQDVLGAWNDVVTEDTDNDWPGGLFNYFSYAGTPSKYGSWGMLQWTGQTLADVPKYRAVATFITNHYPDNPIGPRCSFVKGSSESYGCYRTSSGSKYECGKSSDDGGSWTALSGLTANDNDVVVLDGADFMSKKLYVRVLDGTLASPTFYTYDMDNGSWTERINYFYYSEVMPGHVVPRLPEAGYQGLDTNVFCNLSGSTVVGK